MTKLSVAIVGAGMGGLATAAALHRAGIGVNVYEQAAQFARVGAGIQMLPNSCRVLRGIGVEEKLRKTAFEPYSHLNRVWDTGEIKRELPMPESLYGTPFLCMHRADLHDALYSVLPPGIVHLYDERHPKVCPDISLHYSADDWLQFLFAWHAGFISYVFRKRPWLFRCAYRRRCHCLYDWRAAGRHLFRQPFRALWPQAGDYQRNPAGIACNSVLCVRAFALCAGHWGISHAVYGAGRMGRDSCLPY